MKADRRPRLVIRADGWGVIYVGRTLYRLVPPERIERAKEYVRAAVRENVEVRP